MIKQKSHSLFSYVIVTVMLLILSNVASAACALAFSICTDCPDIEITHCVDMFDADAAAATKATTSHAKVDELSPALITKIPHIPSMVSQPSYADCVNGRQSYQAPPIHLLNCVFLK